MSLSPGTRLGPYEITGPLGAGGMGEVYRARDARLNRDVAIKILPPAFADDASRMARFQREAQVLAALNHPNIAAIYGLESSALVMELVEGQTLAERIADGAIPLDEALAIVHQVADALEAAHEKGIVHRDLKPANVKITPEGKVKVLDFGLAKAYDGASTASEPINSPTLTMEATRAGVILGTAGYMSPEQARGKPVDKRADIWSFGVLLYEMLTGRSTFEGETLSDMLASILKSDPDWNRLPTDTPFGVRRLLRRCLERDPKKRLRDIGDAWNDMDRPEEIKAARPDRQWIPWSVAILAMLGAVTWGWLHAPTVPPRTVTRSVMTSGNRIFGPTLSPDGARLIYSEVPASGPHYLSLRQMDQSEGMPIPGTENAISPAFSPDGQWIVFGTATLPHKLQRIPVTGGSPTTLCETPDIYGAAWGMDDTIVFGSKQGLMRVPAAGGSPQALTEIDPKKGEREHGFPMFLPGGKTVVFTVVAGASAESERIVLLDLKARAQRVVVNAGHGARYVPTGHLVYTRDDTLFAVPFDLKHLAVTGPETPVMEEVLAGNYTFSDTSVLVFRRGRIPTSGESTLEWTDRKGVAQPLPEPPHPWGEFGVSPDGKLVAGSIRDAGGKASDIWIYDLDRRTLVRMTFEGSNTQPIWSPDGRWVTYGSQRDGKRGIYRIAADKSGPPELLLATEFDASPTSWTPDGKTLFYTEYHHPGTSIWTLQTSGNGESKSQRFSPASATEESEGVVSPDGKWVAYSAFESEKWVLYVVPSTGSGGKYQISTHGGIDPAWSRNGRELYYKDYASQLMAVDVPSGPLFRPGTPQPLFKVASFGTIYDVTPDPNRFLVEHQPERPTDNTFVTITNWFDDLLRRAPLKH